MEMEDGYVSFHRNDIVNRTLEAVCTSETSGKFIVIRGRLISEGYDLSSPPDNKVRKPVRTYNLRCVWFCVFNLLQVHNHVCFFLSFFLLVSFVLTSRNRDEHSNALKHGRKITFLQLLKNRYSGKYYFHLLLHSTFNFQDITNTCGFFHEAIK
jgi:hypothetical protein